jgi:Arc/MetJ-type ribon-helix-helix transcriptional regulator
MSNVYEPAIVQPLEVHCALNTNGEKLKLEPVKITIRLPIEFLDQIDLLVDLGDFPNRSEAIRTAVRDMLYQRTTLVLDKMEKKAELKRTMDQINKFNNEYLKQ